MGHIKTTIDAFQKNDKNLEFITLYGNSKQKNQITKKQIIQYIKNKNILGKIDIIWGKNFAAYDKQTYKQKCKKFGQLIKRLNTKKKINILFMEDFGLLANTTSDYFDIHEKKLKKKKILIIEVINGNNFYSYTLSQQITCRYQTDSQIINQFLQNKLFSAYKNEYFADIDIVIISEFVR